MRHASFGDLLRGLRGITSDSFFGAVVLYRSCRTRLSEASSHVSDKTRNGDSRNSRAVRSRKRAVGDQAIVHLILRMVIGATNVCRKRK